MSKQFTLVLVVLVALTSTEAFAQGLFEGTPQEQAACRPDVQKHCKAAVPDVFRVLACLQANRAKISKPCQAVLTNHGQ
jgi:hypothetical protein